MPTCYRIQPPGRGLDHRSRTSAGTLANGVHVFGSLPELCSAVVGWCRQSGRLEIVEIECEAGDLRDNGDYEGLLLVAGRGTITRRRVFRRWADLREWAREYPESLD